MLSSAETSFSVSRSRFRSRSAGWLAMNYDIAVHMSTMIGSLERSDSVDRKLNRETEQASR